MNFHWSKRIGFSIFLVALAIVGVSCKRSHEQAKKVEKVEAQLNLPEMSPEEKLVADKRLEWNIATLNEAYDKVGSRNKKWDADAQKALTFFAQVRAYGSNIKGFPELLQAYLRRAAEQGCDDPMIGYLQVRFQDSSSETTSLQWAQAFAESSNQLEGSRYSPLRKFYASIRALNAYLDVKPWPREGGMYRDRAAQQILAVLEDTTIPIEEIDDAAHEYLVIVNRWNARDAFDQMDAVLQKNWSKYALTYLLEGEFYIDYAWAGRGGGYANTVKPEQWKLFAERLELAEKALLRGMEVDPKDGRLATEMITVASAQSKGLPEMRRWWEKAMEANPNNYKACSQLLNFLLPKWYGSRDIMLEFGKECATSEKFGGTVPLILADAHYTYNRNYGPPDSSYWLEPDVWPDIQLSFEKFFAKNPNAVSWRHNYARYAYWCQQWDTLQEQLKLMGDDINYSYFGGREEFDKMVKLAAEHVAEKQ